MSNVSAEEVLDADVLIVGPSLIFRMRGPASAGGLRAQRYRQAYARREGCFSASCACAESGRRYAAAPATTAETIASPISVVERCTSALRETMFASTGSRHAGRLSLETEVAEQQGDRSRPLGRQSAGQRCQEVLQWC